MKFVVYSTSPLSNYQSYYDLGFLHLTGNVGGVNNVVGVADIDTLEQLMELLKIVRSNERPQFNELIIGMLAGDDGIPIIEIYNDWRE